MAKQWVLRAFVFDFGTSDELEIKCKYDGAIMLFVKTLSDLSVFPENFPSHLAVLSGKFKSGNGSYLFSSSS